MIQNNTKNNCIYLVRGIKKPICRSIQLESGTRFITYLKQLAFISILVTSLSGCGNAVLKPPELSTPKDAQYTNARQDIDIAIAYSEHVQAIFANAASQTEDANLVVGTITLLTTALTAAAGAFDLGEDVLLAAGLGTGTAAGVDAYLNPKQKQTLFIEARNSLQCAIEVVTETTGGSSGSANAMLESQMKTITENISALNQNSQDLNRVILDLNSLKGQALRLSS